MYVYISMYGGTEACRTNEEEDVHEDFAADIVSARGQGGVREVEEIYSKFKN